VAWTLTTTHSDTQDVFIERLDPTDPARYEVRSNIYQRYIEFWTRTETIHVRGGDDEQITIRSTRHGPVISDLGRYDFVDKGYVLALSWPGLLADDRTAVAIHRLNYAIDLNAAFAALHDFHSPQQNFVLADTAGNIGFVAAGRVPIRKALSANSTMPAPGWSGEYDWTGFLPFEELPQVVNPPEGFVATANSKITPEGYAHFITARWPDAYRQERIKEYLRKDAKVTLDSAAEIMRDTYSAAAKEQAAALTGAADLATMPGDEIAQVRDLFARWDFHVDREKAAPLILTTWLREADKAIFAGRLGDNFPDVIGIHPMAAVEAVEKRDPLWCSSGGNSNLGVCLGKLRNALTAALQDISSRYGDDIGQWRWGDAHRARFANALLDRVPLLGDWLFEPLETDGDDYTLNRGTPYIDYDSDEPVFPHIHGASMRAIFDLSNLDNSRFMIAGGQSGNPLSRHYRDLLVRWRDHQYVTMVGQGSEIVTLVPAP